jgi:hypothetical protein
MSANDLWRPPQYLADAIRLRSVEGGGNYSRNFAESKNKSKYQISNDKI